MSRRLRRRAGGAALATAALALLAGGAAALDQSKLPPGADHERAQRRSEGDGAQVGVIEAPESGSGDRNLDPAQTHFAARIAELRDFAGTSPPLTSLPAVASGNSSSHAVLVGDVALSDDATYTGAAPLGELYGGWTLSYNDDRAAHDAYERLLGVGIFNNSWGAGTNTNGTSDYAMFFDWFVANKDVIVVKSAGNTSNQITIPGDAFNIITVGGLDSTGAAFRRRRSFSSYRLSSDSGFAPDLRGKPEIVAPGEQIGNGGTSLSGTSFAAPHVAGVAALLVEAGLALPGPALRNHLAHKAILLNSARKRFINLPRDGDAVALDNSGTDTQPSDDDYLNADGTLRVGMTGGSVPSTDEWTPSSWDFSAGLFTTTAPLDDELGAGVVDAERALLQHAGGEQAPGSVGPLGWSRHCLASGSHAYELEAALREGDFVTATLNWDRAIDSSDGDQDVEASDTYSHHTGGLGFLPDFDLELREQTGGGTTLVAASVGIGGALTGQNVEHLHVPVPRTGFYELHVVLNGSGPDCIDYGFAWWAPVVPTVPAASAAGRAALALLVAAAAGFALARRRR